MFIVSKHACAQCRMCHNAHSEAPHRHRAVCASTAHRKYVYCVLLSIVGGPPSCALASVPRAQVLCTELLSAAELVAQPVAKAGIRSFLDYAHVRALGQASHDRGRAATLCHSAGTPCGEVVARWGTEARDLPPLHPTPSRPGTEAATRPRQDPGKLTFLAQTIIHGRRNFCQVYFGSSP